MKNILNRMNNMWSFFILRRDNKAIVDTMFVHIYVPCYWSGGGPSGVLHFSSCDLSDATVLKAHTYQTSTSEPKSYSWTDHKTYS